MSIHIPVLRAGKPYYSLDTQAVGHFQTGEAVAVCSMANRGLIAKDLREMEANKHLLDDFTVDQLIDICTGAAEHFNHSSLPLGETVQSPQDYINQLSATTGMPKSMCRNNMAKISLVLTEMRAVLGGLSRGLDLTLLDRGWSRSGDRPLSFMCETAALGAILPSNSPGVHSLWMPAIPLKVPLVLKPGRQEPWTPYRVAQSFIAAGCPPEAFSIYPCDHAGATEILLKTGRSMLFGDKNTVAPWKRDQRVQIHGPGWSKVIIAEDEIDNWEAHAGIIVDSVAANGGRSCINASGLWVPRRGREIAEALAKKMATIEARSMDDPEASLAAFSNGLVAERINAMIDSQLKIAGAEDLTAKYRRSPRLVHKFGTTFLLPTVVWCTDKKHPLASVEFLFPFVSVVETAQNTLLDDMGYSLVASAVTRDDAFIRALFATHNIERLNIGSIPTMKISWDQPHEGNLFEHLYRQRALQVAN